MRYENTANLVIELDLGDGYYITAMAKWNKESNNYSTTLYIRRNTEYLLDMMENFENIRFDSTMQTIRNDIMKYVDDKNNTGDFNYYKQRYSDIMRSFDIGEEMLRSQNDR